MASVEEKIQVKRQRTEAFVASLPGQSKKVRVVTFTQAQLPKAHVTETGGLLGMVLFNDGQATFQQDNTSFVRALLMNSNYPNIYNYSSVNQYPQVPHWQNGAALPVYGDCTVDSITARIKSVAEDKGQAGLRSLPGVRHRSEQGGSHHSRCHCGPHLQEQRYRCAASNCPGLPEPAPGKPQADDDTPKGLRLDS